jgi:hypothetical protein
MSDSKISFFNTLIFTIITGTFSLLLLLILLLKNGRQFLPFIITAEVGIFIIIAMCITQIIINEKRKEKTSGNWGDYIKFTQCPDYYIKRFTSEKEICSNEHMYIDPTSREVYTMKIYLSEPIPDIPKEHVPKYDEKNINVLDKFPLSDLDTNSNIKSAEEKCELLFGPPTSDKLKSFEKYQYLPWLSMRSKCRAIVHD